MCHTLRSLQQNCGKCEQLFSNVEVEGGQLVVTVVFSGFRVKGVSTVRISPFGFRHPMPLTPESALSFVRLECPVSVHYTYVFITVDCNQTVSKYCIIITHCCRRILIFFNLHIIHKSQLSQ